MSHKDAILEMLEDIRPKVLCDDCLSVKLNIRPRQSVNLTCRALSDAKTISRIKEGCDQCGAVKISNGFISRANPKRVSAVKVADRSETESADLMTAQSLATGGRSNSCATPAVRMIDVVEVMNALATLRPIFHSEADFQHAFAWQMRQRTPEPAIRLERPVPGGKKIWHLDLLVGDHDDQLAIELKFKTRAFEAIMGGETFKLLGHGAQDIGRYDFIKDVVRLEYVTQNRPKCAGVAVLLTNDSSYWKPRSRHGTVDEAFRLDEGRRTLGGTMKWNAHTGAGTMKNRESALHLTNAYNLKWREFSQFEKMEHGKFRYLLIQVPHVAA